MEKSFSHLRVSSEYSITQGLLTINQLVDCAKKYSVPSIALTDKSNMFAMVKFFNKCFKLITLVQIIASRLGNLNDSKFRDLAVKNALKAGI